MNRIVLLTLLVICTFSGFLFSQRPAGAGGGGPAGVSSVTGKITGVLLDSLTKAPLEFATVVLVNEKDQKEVDGTITESDGSFKLTNLKLGTYTLQVSFIGYQAKAIPGITLTPSKPDVDIPNIRVVNESVNLQEVVVTGDAAVLENRIDKMVYNADKDVTNVGLDAAGVLTKVPMLAVDVEGNVSLRGSSNVRVLINGKPSTIFGSSIADALRTIPSDQIKSVEVITTPGAKYDGEGTAGIINIITKKNNAQGVTGSLDVSVGNRSNRANFNINAVRGRFGMNGSASGFFSWPRPTTTSFYREDYINGQTRTLEQNGEGSSQFLGPRGSFGAFYDINAYNSITSSLSFSGFGRSEKTTAEIEYKDPTRALEQFYERFNDNSRNRLGADWTVDYVKKYKTPDQEFSIAAQVSASLENDTRTIRQFNAFNDPAIYQDEKADNDGLNMEYTFQVDYTHPFGEKGKLETGAKTVIRVIDSDFGYEVRDFDSGIYALDPLRTDIFNYNQDVFAGYVSGQYKLSKKTSVLAGVRYESTLFGGDYETNPTQFSNNYDSWLPNLAISYSLNQFSGFRLSFSKRIERPSLRYINPYFVEDESRNVRIGNPELEPELTDQVELGYNTYVKGVTLSTGLFYRHTNDVIEGIARVNESGGTITTYENIGTNASIGGNGFLSFTVKKFWTVRGGFSVFTYQGEGVVDGKKVEATALLYNANITTSFAFPKKWTFEFSGFYNSPRQSLQGYRASYVNSTFALRKEFEKFKGNVGLVVSQPFSENMRFPSKTTGTTFIQESENVIAMRSIGLSFGYRFGKVDYSKTSRSRRTKINNNDSKSGGDNNF